MKDYIANCGEQLLNKPNDDASFSCSPSHVVICVEQMMMSTVTMETDKGKGQKQPQREGRRPIAECRFCHEEDGVSSFETPCGCIGTLMYAHRSCVQKWCNIKGNTTCEICRQCYRPSYTVIARIPFNNNNEDGDYERREGWRIPGTNAQIYSPLALVEMATNRAVAALNEDCDFRHPSGGVLCGISALIIFIVMIVRDAYYYRPTQQQDIMFNDLTFGLLLAWAPFYLMSLIHECRLWRYRERYRLE